MSKDYPFVIQFSSLDDFLAEALEQEVVRLWPCTFGVRLGDHIIHRTHCVCLQAIDTRQMAVLVVYLHVGRYQEIYGNPFGSEAERIKAVIGESMETAVDLVREAVTARFVTILNQIRPGRIHTNLGTQDIQTVRWPGFEAIYEAQKEAVRE